MNNLNKIGLLKLRCQTSFVSLRNFNGDIGSRSGPSLNDVLEKLSRNQPAIIRHAPTERSGLSQIPHSGMLRRPFPHQKMRSLRAVRKSRAPYKDIVPYALAPHPFDGTAGYALRDTDKDEHRDTVSLPASILKSYASARGQVCAELTNMFKKVETLQRTGVAEDTAVGHTQRKDSNVQQSMAVMLMIDQLLVDVQNFLQKKYSDNSISSWSQPELNFGLPSPASASAAGSLYGTEIDQEEVKGLKIPPKDEVMFVSTSPIRSAAGDNEVDKAKESVPEEPGKPSRAQLMAVHDHTLDYIKVFFRQKMDYSVYHRVQFVFENNWAKKPYVTTGLAAYSLKILGFKFYANTKFSSVGLKYINSDVQEDTGTVLVHWSMGGRSNSAAIPFLRQQAATTQVVEGVSTFYVKSDGLIHRHQVDKIIPDRMKAVKKKPVEKLAEAIANKLPKTAPAMSTSSSKNQTS